MSNMESDRKDGVASPLNFEWNDEHLIDPKAKLDDMDPFLEANDGSLASGDNIDFAETDRILGIPGGDIPRPGTVELDGRKRSVSSTISNQSDNGATISRRKKKPKGMPKRPLSAYNLYFRSERSKILAAAEDEGEKIGFEGLGKIIGKQWRALGPSERKSYEEMAEEDGIRYRKEMETYNETKTKKLQQEEKLASVRVASTAAAEQAPLGGQTRAPPAIYGQGGPSQNDSYDVSSSSPVFPMARPEGIGRPHTMASVGQAPVSAMAPVSYPSQYDVGMQQGLQMHRAQQVNVPPTSQGLEGGPPPNSFPMPPDMEIVLSDQNGKDRKYRVQYTCYAMTREAAHRYIETVMGPSSRVTQQQMISPVPQQPLGRVAPEHQYLTVPQQGTQQLPPGYVPVPQGQYPSTSWSTY